MRMWLISLLLLAPVVSQANVTVVPKVVQQGLWQDEACTADAARAKESSCLCEADVTYIEIAGIPNADAINATIAKRATDAISSLDNGGCSGKKITAAKDADLPSHDQNDFAAKVDFENDALLSISISGWWYGEGAAHGNPWADSMIIDKVTGKVLQASDIIGDLPAANRYIYDALKENTDTFLSSCGDDENHYLPCPKEPKAYVADEKAIGYLAVDEKGLSVNFNVYAVGPYAVGAIDVAIPAKFVKYPAIKQLDGAKHAG